MKAFRSGASHLYLLMQEHFKTLNIGTNDNHIHFFVLLSYYNFKFTKFMRCNATELRIITRNDTFSIDINVEYLSCKGICHRHQANSLISFYKKFVYHSNLHIFTVIWYNSRWIREIKTNYKLLWNWQLQSVDTLML